MCSFSAPPASLLLCYFILTCILKLLVQKWLSCTAKARSLCFLFSSEEDERRGEEGWAVTGLVLTAGRKDGLVARKDSASLSGTSIQGQNSLPTHLWHSAHYLLRLVLVALPQVQILAMTLWKKSRLLAIPQNCSPTLCGASPRDIGLQEGAFSIGDHSCL